MYSTQLITESVKGKHNISDFVQEEISSIQQSDIDIALERAEVFLTKDHSDLESKARIEEITLNYTLEEAKQLIVNQLLSTIIQIKPEILTRGGNLVAYPGVAPMQSVATQLGLALHHDQLDAVQTGIEILSEFHDLGIYRVNVTKEEDRSANRGGHIEVHGDSALIHPTMHISLELHLRIKATQYLPPMLVKPLHH